MILPSAIEIFETHRPKLLGLAYRITGSTFEAEDIVQEACLKWMKSDHQSIQAPYPWLITVTTRMALDYLKSARVQRESYIGPWLPEPFLAEEVSPEGQHELDESITMALLVLLEQLSPAERAAFILHDLFQFNFDEIGEILGKSGTSCRKLASRARSKVGQDRVQDHPDKEAHLAMVNAFFGAVKNGDMQGLVELLKDNVILHADGGGKAIAALEILQGLETVAGFLIDKVSPSFSHVDAQHVSADYTWFNGSPGFVIWVDNTPVSAFNFEIDVDTISKIHVLRNPDKLRLFTPPRTRAESTEMV